MCKGASVIDKCQASVASSSVYFAAKEEDLCVSLISHKVADNEYQLLDPTDINTKAQGLTIHTKEGQNFSVILHCKADATVPVFTVDIKGLRIESSDACAYVNEPAKILFTHKYILSSLMVILGSLLVLIGGYKWNLIVGVFGFFTGVGSIFFIFWAFVDFTPETTSYVIIAVLAITVGILLAYVCTTIITVSYAALGFVGGYFLSKYLTLIFQLLLDQWKLSLIYYASAILLALVCLWLQKRIITLVAALLGGVLVSYHIGFMMNLLGNFFDIIERIKSGQPMETAFYVFVGIAAVLAVAGMTLQYRWISKEEVSLDEDEHFKRLY